ncbi:hypothetical protein GOP47_0016271 [Adiantum capillus-veneris]|uniref:fructose-bisphosphate aldolase n=1 Tax=Adiantum capillus-veneris TaxID=13818 RepID=A0A9D4UHC0_ADICA|nr:hypothetical protein GOP47_0016271 [Adiantum capillus-veneris]
MSWIPRSHGHFLSHLDENCKPALGRLGLERKTWAGKKEKIPAAQAALLARCKANSEAVLGKYVGDAAKGFGTDESLHVANYKLSYA